MLVAPRHSQNPIELRFSLHLLRCASVFHSHMERRFRKEFENYNSPFRSAHGTKPRTDGRLMK